MLLLTSITSNSKYVVYFIHHIQNNNKVYYLCSSKLRQSTLLFISITSNTRHVPFVHHINTPIVRQDECRELYTYSYMV